MRIQYISDIHLEFLKNDIPSFNIIAPVLCLAGDIGNPFLPSYTEFLCNLNQQTNLQKIFLIPGNHEYYNKKKWMYEINEHIKSIIINNNLKKVSLLINDTEMYNDYLFCGTVLWSRWKRDECYINDKYQIKGFTVGMVNQLHNESRQFIMSTIANNKDKKIIMMTHHLPSYELLDKKYEKYADYNHCFASNCDDLIIEPIKLWIYGHTHTESIKIINNIPCICNPIGYPGENPENTYETYYELE